MLTQDIYFFYESSLSHGLLPKWLLFVALVSIGNSIQAYMTIKYTQKVYAGKATTTATTPSKDTNKDSSKDSAQSNRLASGSVDYAVPSSYVNPLSARTFGTWTFLSSIVRLYAALHIHDPLMYQLALWSYALAFGHFASEWFVFGTVKWGPGLAGPVIVSTSSLIWMAMVWKDYIH